MGQHSRLISCGTAKGENKAGRGNNLCGEGPTQGCPHYMLSKTLQSAEKYEEWPKTNWEGCGWALCGQTGHTTVVFHGSPERRDSRSAVQGLNPQVLSSHYRKCFSHSVASNSVRYIAKPTDTQVS